MKTAAPDEAISLRKRVAASARRIVVKVGSNVLAAGSLGLDAGVMANLVGEIATLARDGRSIVLVSSGAILAGRVLLGMEERPKLLPEKQACAAVGQPELLGRYRELFGWYGRMVSQVLLTAEDLRDRKRYLNAKNTLRVLLDRGIVPIVNENDTVSVEEIKFGDNDMLSAHVANLVEAELLVILSDVAGFFTADPRVDPEARLIELVEELSAADFERAGKAPGRHGLGGMASKLEAASRLMKSGIPTIVAPGKRPGALTAILSGESLGTLFRSPEGDGKLSGRKTWLAYLAHPRGSLGLDPGACRAITEQGKSLLPSGVTAVQGEFDLGDPVLLLDPDGHEVARGLVNYSAADVTRIMGKHSSVIESILGRKDYDEVIHRDNLARK